MAPNNDTLVNHMEDKKKPSHPIPDILIDMIGDHFLEAANHLRTLHDEVPDQFIPVVKQLGIGLRKAYALAQIDRAFHDRGIERERLRRLGWTKLAMLAPYVDDDNIETLLALAEERPTHALRRLVQGSEIDPKGRIVALYLDTRQIFVFDKVMETFGAVKAPRGWVLKETALLKAMECALEHKA
ncbi:MAG: hypothetical protein QM676_07320 [Novosphingobium sp.]